MSRIQTNIQIIMIVSGKDNHVWPFLSLCSLTNVLTLENMRIFCPNFNNLAKTKLVFHCNGLNFAQKHFVQRWRVPFFSFSFFFFVFFFLSCIITASNPCQSHRCPEDSACYHNDTHFTCVSHTQEDSNRKNGEIFFTTVIFPFSWC